MTIGEYVAEERKARKWSQEQLETLSGIKRGYLASLETNRINKPPADVFLKLANAFRVKPEELFKVAGYNIKGGVSKEETIGELLRSIRADLHRLEKLVNLTYGLISQPLISPFEFNINVNEDILFCA